MRLEQVRLNQRHAEPRLRRGPHGKDSMTRFTPLRPPATRLLIPLPSQLQDADQNLAARLSRRPPPAEAARIAIQALDLAVPCKAQALTGYLRTLNANQPTAVAARNALEQTAAIEHASLADAEPNKDPAQWRSEGGTLILKASPDMSCEDLSGALYLIFLGRPLRLTTLKRLEAMAAATVLQAPPHVVHMIAPPSLDSRIADILLAPNAADQPPAATKAIS